MPKQLDKLGAFSKYFLFALAISIFTFLRLYRLPQTLNMFGDLARDFLVMQNWQTSGRPPLLGPQNSAISFNQSAVYFYLLYPFYLISGGSAYATTMAGVVYYLIGFFLLWKYYSQQPNIKNKISWLILLTAVWPTLVVQHREIWNPSFVPLAMLLAFFSWQKWLKNIRLDSLKPVQNKWLAWLTAFGLSFAIALNFASVPAVLVTAVCVLVTMPVKKRIAFILQLFAASFILNLPTLVFELRHNFFMLRKLPTQELLQVSSSFPDKINQYLSHLFNLSNWNLPVSLIVLAVFLLIIFQKKPSKERVSKLFKQHPEFAYSLIILLGASVLLLISPFQVHSHYVVANLIFLLIALSFTPKINFLLAAIFIAVYYRPIISLSYFQPTPVTIKEKTACVRKLSKYDQPIYFNLNSPSHNHQALGYIYLGRKAGLEVVAVDEFEQKQPSLMAVFNQRAKFEIGQTDYYELSLFEDRQLFEEIDCTDDLSVSVFKKL